MISQNTYNIFIQCLDVCVGRNPLKINLHVWFYFIVFLTILYNTCESGHSESSVLLSLSASCFVLCLYCITAGQKALFDISQVH